MTNNNWFKSQLSHRGCIKVITEIAKIARVYGMTSITTHGEDSQMFEMLQTIRGWRTDSINYRKLKKLINE